MFTLLSSLLGSVFGLLGFIRILMKKTERYVNNFSLSQRKRLLMKQRIRSRVDLGYVLKQVTKPPKTEERTSISYDPIVNSVSFRERSVSSDSTILGLSYSKVFPIDDDSQISIYK